MIRIEGLKKPLKPETLVDVYMALDNDLEVLPVLNKVDLPSAEPERVSEEIEEVIGLDCTDVIQVSAKTGLGVDTLLENLVEKVPPPKGDTDAPLKAAVDRKSVV